MKIRKQEDIDTIGKIADRAMSIGVYDEKMTALMDIESAHNDIPLRLQELLGADDANFAHDIIGIMSHLNRTTFKLDGVWHPRFAVTQ